MTITLYVLQARNYHRSEYVMESEMRVDTSPMEIRAMILAEQRIMYGNGDTMVRCTLFDAYSDCSVLSTDTLSDRMSKMERGMSSKSSYMSRLPLNHGRWSISVQIISRSLNVKSS